MALLKQTVVQHIVFAFQNICISKEPVDYFKCNFVDFRLGEYHWGCNKVNTADYLYTAIMCAEEHKRQAYMERLKYILDYYNIKYKFEEPKFEIWGSNTYLENGSIDHNYGTIQFVEAVLANEDMLMRLLFGDSAVYTGNDNCDCDNEKCRVASRWGDNLNYDPDKYDYFYKSN